MPDEQINANRRRKDSTPPTGRADAPVRRQPSTSGTRPTSTGGGGLPIPRSGKAKGGCGSILVLILLVAYFILSGGEGLDTGDLSQPYEEQPYVEQAPQSARPVANFTPQASAANGEQTWLVMLYQDADDQVLEKDIYIDLNEAERVGSSDNVKIVTQIDRFQAAYSGDGNWTGARRYYVTQDDDLENLGSQLIADLGEVNMSDSDTLIDFVSWSVENFPSDRYVLIMSDHGMGWPGGWSDPAPGGRRDSNVPLAAQLGQNIYLMELDEALGTLRTQTGIEKFDILGMDACLMAQLEVFAALQPHARYAIASEETEPALGWAYTGFLQALVDNPGMSPEDLSKLIVQSYIDTDQRIVDEAARADFLHGGSPMGGLFSQPSISAAELAQQLKKNVTLTAVDLEKLPLLMNSFNEFAYALQDEDQRIVAEARSYAQSYTSIFGEKVPPAYLDLGSFTQLVSQNSRNNNTATSAANVIAAIDDVVIAERHGNGKAGSSGIAIYFPNSALYRSTMTGMQSYTGIAERFANESLWDEFIGYHYADREFDFDVQTQRTPSNEITRVPGQGQINVSPLRVDSTVAAPGQPITLSADIQGENIGHIYLFVGYLDTASNAIYVADMDYLESPDTREVNGVYYPQWGKSGNFSLSFVWDPIVFAIWDGSTTAEALFSPQNYGQSAENAVYAVEGTYTFAETGETRNARLYFQNESLQSVFVFSGQDVASAPSEVTPTEGDSFTIFQHWLDLNDNGSVREEVSLPGKTLTFGAETFKWQQLYAAQGEYILGFLIEDMDGQQFPVYTKITVE